MGPRAEALRVHLPVDLADLPAEHRLADSADLPAEHRLVDSADPQPEVTAVPPVPMARLQAVTSHPLATALPRPGFRHPCTLAA